MIGLFQGIKMGTPEVFSGEIVEGGQLQAPLPTDGRALQQVQTRYTTAVVVQKPRDLEEVRQSLLMEAKLGGEAFYYGWGQGKDRIEGASVDLAMAAARCYHNCAVDVLPIQETDSSWIVTSVFIDLETGFTTTRQFRQSKKWTVHGKHDAERKDDIRFQIGQSKAVRNVILNALPKWLINQAMQEAKQGVREKIESFVKNKGLPAAVDLVLGGLSKHGVLLEHVLEKCEAPKLEALTIDHVVVLRGDLSALDNRQDYATNLFPSIQGSVSGGKASKSDLDEKLNRKKSNGNESTNIAAEKMVEIESSIFSADKEELKTIYDFYVGAESPLPQNHVDIVSNWCDVRGTELDGETKEPPADGALFDTSPSANEA